MRAAGAQERPTVEELREAVARSESLAAVLRRLGRPDNGGQRTLLRRWLTEAGISTKYAHWVTHDAGDGLPSTCVITRASAVA